VLAVTETQNICKVIILLPGQWLWGIYYWSRDGSAPAASKVGDPYHVEGTTIDRSHLDCGAGAPCDVFRV
jgi:hypothetical protein